MPVTTSIEISQNVSVLNSTDFCDVNSEDTFVEVDLESVFTDLSEFKVGDLSRLCISKDHF